MKYQTGIPIEAITTPANTSLVISGVENARTPNPRNPTVSTKMQNSNARDRSLLGFLPFISNYSRDCFPLDAAIREEH
jgi:hypothetical protein